MFEFSFVVVFVILYFFLYNFRSVFSLKKGVCIGGCRVGSFFRDFFGIKGVVVFFFRVLKFF